MKYSKLLKNWNEMEHHQDLEIIKKYLIKFLKYAYKNNLHISFDYLTDTRDGAVKYGKTYDIYRFWVDILDDDSKNLSVCEMPMFPCHYIEFHIRTCRRVDSNRPMLDGVYQLYLGNSWASEDCNCSFYDISDESQTFNMKYREVVSDCINTIIKNPQLDAWLVLQGINVRNIL